MSHQALQFIIGTALTDSEFCQRLLQKPDKATASFDLTGAERAAIASIEAECLTDFAHELHQWIVKQNSAPTAPPRCSLNSHLPPTPWPSACLLSTR